MQQAWLQTEAGVEQTEVCRSPGCSCTHDTNFIRIDTKVDFSRNVLRQRERVEWHVGGGQGIGERSSEGGGRSVGQGGRTGQQELGLGKQGELGVAAPPPCWREMGARELQQEKALAVITARDFPPPARLPAPPRDAPRLWHAQGWADLPLPTTPTFPTHSSWKG